jgi:uncharacterized protein YfaS (alpha-2-macroglobulin family)
VILAVMLSAAIVRVAGQPAPLSIVSASPRGDLADLADAGQVRIVFSEPMVALGAIPTGVAPAWIHLTPQVAGSFYWSGTTTLIFSPDSAAPLPLATTYTVRVDAGATSLSGRTLDTPFLLTFTTPPVQVISSYSYRKDGRFDRPVVIALKFNQPMNGDAAIARTRVRLEAHEWTPPALSERARAFLQQTDPGGLRRFDDKVARARQMAARDDSVSVRLASSWDEERLPREPNQVVIETADAPPSGAWLHIDTPAAQPAIVKLEPAFFVTGVQCESRCSGEFNPIRFTLGVPVDQFANALRIVDVTDPAHTRSLVRARRVSSDAATSPRAEILPADVGFEPQLAMRTRRLRVAADLRAADGQTLGYPWVGFVQTGHDPAMLALDGSVLEAGRSMSLPLVARNVQSIRAALSAVTPSALVAGLRELAQVNPARAVGGVTRQFRLTPDVVETHTLDLSRLLSPRGTGLVRADVAIAKELAQFTVEGGQIVLNETVSPYMRRAQSNLLQVTNLGLTVKAAPQSTLAFVTRLDTGEPVAGVNVAILGTEGETQWRGTTDRDGVVLGPAPLARADRNPTGPSFVVTAEKDGDVAFVTSDWPHERLTNSEYDEEHSSATLRGSIFTDRGVYKPGEEAHVKAVLRNAAADGMQTPPAGAEFDVVMRDEDQHEVDRRRVAVTRWGSADWTWLAPADASLGFYTIEVSRAGAGEDDDRVIGKFRVAAFRRPDFRVDATLAAEPPVLGSTLRATTEASYLFGAPVGARTVRWFLGRNFVQQPPDAILDHYPDDRYVVGYLPDVDSPEPTSKEETLGDDGRLSVTVPTTAGADAATTYTFEADVEGTSHQHVAGRTALVVHPASLYVALTRPQLFVEAKGGTRTTIAAVDLAGKTIAGVAVTVSLVREEWVRQKGSARFRYFDWVRREIAAGEWTLQTTSGDTPLTIPIPESGSYVLRAIARDAAGRPTRTEASFYALGSGLASWMTEGDTIDLVPERKTWKPGETARVLVQSPWPNATALVTAEREGVRWHRRLTIRSTQDVVEVPITEADVPNLFVSVLLVKGRTPAAAGSTGDPGAPAYRLGTTELTIDTASKRLGVTVSTDRDVFRPADPVHVSVAVAAADGRPAAGEVTLWAVDRGLLALTGYTTPDLVKAIYEPGSLQVVTADNRQNLVGHAVAGGAPGSVAEQVASSRADSLEVRSEDRGDTVDGVRQDFRPLVFWLGSAQAGADGRVATTVTLPDSLTTYRIMAVAGTEASQFGFGEHEVRVTKPLTLLPALPRFLNSGDRAALAVVVTNAGTGEGTADVTFESLDPQTLQLLETRRSIRLAPGASQPVAFDAVAAARGEARVRISATLGAETDAVQLPLTITQPIVRTTTAAYGDTAATATERLALPAGILRDTGGLTVDLSSSALVGLGDSARYLDQYPYGCAEQKASRALVLLLASDPRGAFAMPGVSADESRARAASALRELTSYQCSDGFALWPGQCENQSAYLTAYVLHVMKLAGTMRIDVDQDAVDRALGFLERGQPQPAADSLWWPVWALSEAYSLDVLAEFDRTVDKRVNTLAAAADRLPIAAVAHLASALAASGDAGARYQDLVRRLTNAVRVDADRAHVEERDADQLAWLWNSNVTATAIALESVARRKDPTLAAPLARWLLTARTNGRWQTTHENAVVLDALASYARAFEAQTPRMQASVSLGPTALGSVSFDGPSSNARQILVPMPDLLTRTASTPASSLSITRTGEGRLFYTTRIETASPVPAGPIDRGIQVERRYERYVKDKPGAAATSFSAGDLIRVTVALTIRGEGRYLAVTDPLPAGFEPLEDWALTTPSDLAAVATRVAGGNSWLSWWHGGYFDHFEKRDDRVMAFATRLGSGHHEFSYLVRATTAGTFEVAGATVEAMYAPEFGGRSQAATVTVR